jgi:hypothetical protein
MVWGAEWGSPSRVALSSLRDEDVGATSGAPTSGVPIPELGTARGAERWSVGRVWLPAQEEQGEAVYRRTPRGHRP